MKLFSIISSDTPSAQRISSCGVDIWAAKLNLSSNLKKVLMISHVSENSDIRASGEVRAEGPNRASAATLGKMAIKIQTTSPPPRRMNLRKIILITLGVIFT